MGAALGGGQGKAWKQNMWKQQKRDQTKQTKGHNLHRDIRASTDKPWKLQRINRKRLFFLLQHSKWQKQTLKKKLKVSLQWFHNFNCKHFQPPHTFCSSPNTHFFMWLILTSMFELFEHVWTNVWKCCWSSSEVWFRAEQRGVGVLKIWTIL